MRRALIALALLCPAAALAEPVPASGWAVEELPLDLKQPSGLAWSDGHLVVSDLASGRIVRVEADGALTDLTAPLPIGLDVMGQPTGPYKVLAASHAIYAAQGWPDANAEPAPTDHSLIQLAGAGAAPRVIANDFWNPYDFAKAGDRWLVVDAGRNALVSVDAAGASSLVYEFPRLKREPAEMSALSPTEFAEGAEPYEVDAVPTGLAISDNRAWVALFGGFPFTPKGGAVVSLPLEGEGAIPRAEIDGLDTPIDVDFTDDGNMLILEMGTFDMATGFAPGTGRLSIVDPGVGKPMALLTGLDQPTCVLVVTDGDIYVSSLSGHVYRLKRAG